MQQAQHGDREAFSELVRRHHQMAYRTAVTILRSRDDAEDEVQNSFLKAFQHLGTFQGGCRFSTWLTRILVNQCLMRIRRLRRERFSSLDAPVHPGEPHVPREIADPNAETDRAMAGEEVEQLLRREIQRIPPMLRQAFLLRHIENLPMSEVAEELGITQAAAKSRLLRARLELQERLLRHQGRKGVATFTF